MISTESSKVSSKINAFLSRGEALTVTHVRRGVPIDGVEQFIRKLLYQALKRRDIKVGVHVDTLVARGSVWDLSRGKLPIRPAMEMMDLFAERHALGLRAYALRLRHQPRGGAGLANASAVLANVDDKELRAASDSVVRNAFADAYATLLIGRTHGKASALQAAENVLVHRHKSGDLGVFSKNALSQDTEWGLRYVKSSLSGMSDADIAVSLTDDKISEMAMDAAVENFRGWLNKHGVTRTRNIAETFRMVEAVPRSMGNRPAPRTASAMR